MTGLARLGPGVLVAGLVLVLDQVTKAWALAGLAPGTVREVTSFFDLVLVWNRGMSFGMLRAADQPWLLIGLAFVIALALLTWLVRETKPWSRLALCLVLAGALGNVIDRLRHGAVVDFLDFHLGTWHWPAFNVADAAITVGAVLLVLDGLLLSRPDVDQETGKAR